LLLLQPPRLIKTVTIGFLGHRHRQDACVRRHLRRPPCAAAPSLVRLARCGLVCPRTLDGSYRPCCTIALAQAGRTGRAGHGPRPWHRTHVMRLVQLGARGCHHPVHMTVPLSLSPHHRHHRARALTSPNGNSVTSGRPQGGERSTASSWPLSLAGWPPVEAVRATGRVGRAAGGPGLLCPTATPPQQSRAQKAALNSRALHTTCVHRQARASCSRQVKLLLRALHSRGRLKWIESTQLNVHVSALLLSTHKWLIASRACMHASQGPPDRSRSRP
jgi:hypothetical protein